MAGRCGLSSRFLFHGCVTTDCTDQTDAESSESGRTALGIEFVRDIRLGQYITEEITPQQKGNTTVTSYGGEITCPPAPFTDF
jgi:hypothetical protein